MTTEEQSCRRCCTQLVDVGVKLDNTVVLEHVNLHIHCGQLTIVIGPNGGGKTTLLRAILGEVTYTGELRFIQSHGEERRQPAPRIGYVPQRAAVDALAPVSVLDLFAGAITRRPLCFGYTRKMRREAEASLATVGVPHLIEKKVGQLSGGQFQRVLLALALTPLPNLLLLDEPISGIDQAGIDMFYHMVSELRERYDLSILLVSHDLSVAAHVANQMVFLNKTILASGPPREVLASQVVRDTLGQHAATPHGGGGNNAANGGKAGQGT